MLVLDSSELMMKLIVLTLLLVSTIVTFVNGQVHGLEVKVKLGDQFKNVNNNEVDGKMTLGLIKEGKKVVHKVTLSPQ